jgi:hypothetical protein
MDAGCSLSNSYVSMSAWFVFMVRAAHTVASVVCAAQSQLGSYPVVGSNTLFIVEAAHLLGVAAIVGAVWVSWQN